MVFFIFDAPGGGSQMVVSTYYLLPIPQPRYKVVHVLLAATLNGG